jgi:hypothetical protein
MAAGDPNRTIYGANKYAAFHLLLARWLRRYSSAPRYCYVTLGGTELRDIQSMRFIDKHLCTAVDSFETDEDRYPLAIETAKRLKREFTLNADVHPDNLFDFVRKDDAPHLFFLDLEGTCALADYHVRFAELIRRQVLRVGDAFFITSYLGLRVGWNRLFDTFDGEFRLLGANTAPQMQAVFKRAHPSFTLFRALREADFQNEVELRCIGSITYRDTSPMGLYGYTIAEGTTSFRDFVNETPYFDVRSGLVHLLS